MFQSWKIPMLYFFLLILLAWSRKISLFPHSNSFESPFNATVSSAWRFVQSGERKWKMHSPSNSAKMLKLSHSRHELYRSNLPCRKVQMACVWEELKQAASFTMARAIKSVAICVQRGWRCGNENVLYFMRRLKMLNETISCNFHYTVLIIDVTTVTF